MLSKLRSCILIIAATYIIFPASAATYYSVLNGNWTGAIWSSVCSTCTPGSTLPALAAGDIIIIDNQVTIGPGTLTIAPAVTVIVRTDFSPNTSTNPAKLIFANGGKLVLSSSGSSVVLQNVTGNASNNPQIDGTGNGGSNLISIGGVEYWRASDGDIQGVGTLQPNGTLPITLISFVANYDGNFIELKWVTAMEKNFSHFELERSSGDLKFVPITYIDGEGSLDVLTSYIYLDSLPQSGKNYYRLKSVDYDLSFEYSPVVVADAKTAKQLIVYPNPAVGSSINVRTNFTPQEGDRIEIYDNHGFKLMEYSITDFENALQFNSLIKQGAYLLRYVSSSHTQVVRFSCH